MPLCSSGVWIPLGITMVTQRHASHTQLQQRECTEWWPTGKRKVAVLFDTQGSTPWNCPVPLLLYPYFLPLPSLFPTYYSHPLLPSGIHSLLSFHPVEGLSRISITIHSGVVFLDILKPNETRGWHAKVGRCRPVERDSLRPLLPSLLPSPLLPSLSPSLLPIPLFHPPPSLFPTFLWVEQWSGHVLNMKLFVLKYQFVKVQNSSLISISHPPLSKN